MREIIEQLVREELARANKKFPGFNSNHEAYAVLLEEVEELQEVSSCVPEWLKMLWKETRGIPGHYIFSQKTVTENLRQAAIMAAEEAIQVAAMCDKWMMLLEKEK